MPYRHVTEAPKVERVSATSARVTLGGESEVVHLGGDGKYQAAVERGGQTTVLLDKGQVKAWSELEFESIRPGIDRGGL